MTIKRLANCIHNILFAMYNLFAELHLLPRLNLNIKKLKMDIQLYK